MRRDRRRLSIAHLMGVMAIVLPTVWLASFPVFQAHASPTSASSLAAEKCSAKGQVATVDRVSKGLRIKHGHDWKSAKQGTAVLQGDTLETRSGQKASATICGGGTVYLNQGSIGVFSSRSEVRAQQGVVAERTAKKGNQGLRTRDATAKGPGAYFEVKAQRGQSVYVVASGSVEVRNARGRVQVTSDHQTAVRTGRAPQAPTQVDAQKALNWASPLVETWVVLTAPGVLQGPLRVALDSQGNIYVTDHGVTENRVVELSPSGKVLTTWHLQGPYQRPYGIAVNAQGTVYVVDEDDENVQSFTSSGQYLATFGSPGFDAGQFLDPSGLALDREGNLYVTEAGKMPIQKLSPTGAPLAVIGTQGDGPGQFQWPNGVTVDSQGNLYVADGTAVNDRIQKLSPGGQVLSIWGSTGTAPGQFKGPHDVALDPQGNVYVADWGNARIQEFSPTGQSIRVLGQLGLNKPGELAGPEGVAVDGKGNLFVADNGNKRIQEFVRSP